MFEISLGVLAAFCFVALRNWPLGLYAVVVMALIQDPMRKLVPGQPPFFILFCGAVFAAAMVGAGASRVNLFPNVIIGWYRYLNWAFTAFAVIVVAQAFNSLLRYGNPMIPALGLISYLAPFVALGLAFNFMALGGVERVKSFLVFYCICASTALSTLWLQNFGVDWPILGEVGVGIQITDIAGTVIAHSGTFRASEIAAWHAATCSCLAILLTGLRKVAPTRLLVAILLLAALASVGILTGRRKMLVQIIIFASAYLGLLAVYLRGTIGWALAAGILCGIAYLGDVFAFGLDAGELADRSAEYSVYMARSKSVFEAIPERFTELGLVPVMWAYGWFGIFGGGVGIGTQGVQHLAEMGDHIGAAEGGLGKIALELGVPGLFIAGWLAVAFLRHILLVLRYVSERSPEVTRLACGLAALLIANAASFSVATQTYGDIFVLLFLGLTLGALLAAPVLANPELSRPPPVRPQPPRTPRAPARTGAPHPGAGR